MEKRTIELYGYTLDIYEDGTVYRHDRMYTLKSGKEFVVKGKIVTARDNGKGYKNCHFWENKKYKHEYVHRLVGFAFLSNPNNLPEINHIDGNRSNNHFSNLEWCDRKHNVNDYVKKGRGVYGNRRIAQVGADGKDIATFGSIKEAATFLGCTHENISCVLRGKGKTAVGFFWRYLDPPKRMNHFKNI